jgi:sugar lactone lactonase YvrE
MRMTSARGLGAGLLGLAMLIGLGPLHARAQEGDLAIANAGFRTPESVLYDAGRDVYLVSNINGGPSEEDNNGFISMVSPDGQVKALHWIQAQKNGVTLHAPKGMAIHAGTLHVSDIRCVRRFQLSTGAPAGETCVDGATFLNDVVAAPDGTIYVSDTGIRIGAGGVEPTGTDAVYRITAAGEVQTLARGKDLANPNGLAWSKDGVLLVPFGGRQIWRFDSKGARTVVATLPAGQLDGLLRLDDGTLVISSWEAQALFRVTPKGEVSTLAEGIPSPADLGWDPKRRRVLVPVFTEDRVISRRLP